MHSLPSLDYKLTLATIDARCISFKFQATVGVTKKFPLHLHTTLVERLKLQKKNPLQKRLSNGACVLTTNILLEGDNVGKAVGKLILHGPWGVCQLRK